MSQPIQTFPSDLDQAIQPIEVSVVLPCLNERETVGICVAKAMAALESAGISGEVIVADNGSTDGSIELAQSAGARVVNVAAARIRQCASRRNPGGPRRLRSDGRLRRQLRFRAHPSICRATEEWLRSGDGQPFSRRHPQRSDAPPPPLSRQPRAHRNRPAFLSVRPAEIFTAASAPSAKTATSAWTSARPAWNSPARWW